MSRAIPRRLLTLKVAVSPLFGVGVSDAVGQVFFEHLDGHRLRRPGRGRGPREDADAVFVLLNHPGMAPDLAFDSRQPLAVVGIIGGVPVHGRPFVSCSEFLPTTIPYPPSVSRSRNFSDSGAMVFYYLP